MATKATESITIKPVDMRTFRIRIVGETPLIVHAWSEKAKKEIRDKQTGKASKINKKEAKNTIAEAAGAAYWMDGAPDVKYSDWTEELFAQYAKNARFGFPVTAIKQCGMNAVYRSGMSKNMVSLKGAFFIRGEGSNQLAQIHFERLTVREDNVHIGMGTSDLRYRPEFDGWYMDLDVSYNANGILNAEDIVNMLTLGGMTNGIGEWRIEKDGNFGVFHVESVV